MVSWKAALGAALILCAQSVPAMDSDKQLHAFTTSFIGFGLNSVFDDYETALAVCTGVGLAKEVYDEFDYRGFSGADLVADGLGCALGVVSSEFLGLRVIVTQEADAYLLNVSFDI